MKSYLINLVVCLFIFSGISLKAQPVTNLELTEDCILVNPDPNSNQVVLEGALSLYEIEILDDDGQVYQTINTTSDEYLIDICNLPDDIFFISMKNININLVEVVKMMPAVINTTVLNPPIIQTPLPVIHLAENLDEQDQLGWCIDTQGNGFSNNLHAHSCKPSGGDVQFVYDEVTKQICSAEFTDFCIEMVGGPVEGMSLNLLLSDTNSPNQKFIYNQCGEFRPEEDTSLCLAVRETSGNAGIYMFRSLTLELSSETDVELKNWVILE